MTAQVGDQFKFKGGKHEIVAISEPIDFHPETYGIIPESICTACWNGYWCEYEISDKGITLNNLYINAKDDYYPSINGVVPVSTNNQKNYQYMGHHLYKGINLSINYTGKIVAGSDFLREYYIHMGYQRAWAYKILTEFVFENGTLKQTIDHSKVAEQLREQIDEMTRNPQKTSKITDKEISNFIDESFSLDIKKKTWWI